MGAVNPDIIVERNGTRAVVERKTGPQTWLFKAVKQAMLYREVGKPVLVASRPLGSSELVYLSRYHHAVITCTPDNNLDCRKRLLEVLEA